MFYGRMCFLSMTLRLCLWWSPAIAYKLPLLDGPLLTDGDNTIDKSNNSPFDIKWEWQSPDIMNEGTFILERLRREIGDNKFNKGKNKPDGNIVPKGKTTEPPLGDLSDTTAYILKESSAAVPKVEKMELLNENETTPSTDLEQTSKGAGQNLHEEETSPLIDVEQTSKGAGENLDEDETTHLTNLEKTTQKAGEKLFKDKSTPLTYLEKTTKGAGENLDEDETTPLTNLEKTTKKAGEKLFKDKSTPLTYLEKTTKGAGENLDEDETTPLTNLEKTTKTAGQKLDEDETTPLKDLEQTSVLTIAKYNKVTTVNKVLSTDSQDKSSQQTSANDKLLEDITSSLSPKAASPSSTPVILHDVTTGHDVIAASSGSSAKPAAITHITTLIEDKVHTQHIMRQCMLTILILAVVCTIFIISTIALAAKLSTMKQKNKLRHPVTYTEMRCISSLLPNNDQQTKTDSKRLKTFTSNMEESDGDNTTLNSFLPEH